MGLDKTDTLIYTNIGNNKVADKKLLTASGEQYF